MLHPPLRFRRQRVFRPRMPGIAPPQIPAHVRIGIRPETGQILRHRHRDSTLAHTGLAKAQPMSIILKLFELAVRVVRYKDRIKLSLLSQCPVRGLLQRVTEVLYQVRSLPNPA